MNDITAKSKAFRALHKPGEPFIIPNPWDAGSARILEGLGFRALATTSSGLALTYGRRDYGVTRDQAIDHCRDVSAAVDIPVTADLENGFGVTAEDAAATINAACLSGLCGGSIEDYSGDSAAPIIDQTLAVERIAAASEAARASNTGFVLTARAEGFLHGEKDLDAVIARLVAFEAAGADVLYAPGLPDMAAVRSVCAALEKPVNVLVIRGLEQHTVAEFAEAGAARLSVGGALAYAAYGSLAGAQAMINDGDFAALSPGKRGAGAIAPFLS